MKKSICLMLATVLIAAMMGGCGNVDPTNTTASQEDQFKPLEYSEIYAPGSYQPDSGLCSLSSCCPGVVTKRTVSCMPGRCSGFYEPYYLIQSSQHP